MGEPTFWDDNDAAQKTIAELKSVKSIVGPMDDLTAGVSDLDALFEMAGEDPEVATEVAGEVDRLEKTLEDLELRALLSGPNDGAGAIVTINARFRRQAQAQAQAQAQVASPALGSAGETAGLEVRF